MRTRQTTTARWLSAATLVALCAAVAGQAWLSLLHKSLTFDEVTYIPSGYSYVVTGDYRLNPEHPPLMKLLAGAALLPLHPRLDTSSPAWESADQWTFGRDFFERSNVGVERLVRTARLPTVVLTMLLVVAAYALAGELYGRGAGLVAASLSAFSPNLLAHGRLATNDLGLAFTIVLVVYVSLRFTRRPTARNLVMAGVALGLALLTKYNAILLLGFVPLWLVASAAPDGGLSPPDGRWLERVPQGRPRRMAFAVGCALSVVLIALFVVTVGYRAPGHLEPYVQGLRTLYTNVHTDMPAYFNGSFHPGGVPYYFLAVFLLKTPTAFLVLLALRVGDQAARREMESETALFVLLPVLAWLAVVSATAVPFGLRYILPVYPLLFVYAAGIVSSPTFKQRWLQAAVAGLALLFASGSLRAFPHYLPYFNAIAGGPENGIEWLDDSNVDWGQDLPLLQAFVEEHGVTNLTVAPMAWYDPAIYGVHGRVVEPSEMLRLLADPDAPPGVYAASAHLLTRGRYSRSSTFDPLNDLEPVAILGHSIYVFER